MTYSTRFCTALLLLTPALAAAQDPVPSPPKAEIVTIRSAGGTIELKGVTSADLFEFTHRCESRQGISAPAASLSLPIEIEGGPNAPLEQATALLREAVARGFLVTVEASGESESKSARVMFTWGGVPAFEGVIDSVSVKYTMFLESGTPVRATANLRMTEPSRASVKKGAGKDGDKSDTKKESDCSPSQH